MNNRRYTVNLRNRSYPELREVLGGIKFVLDLSSKEEKRSGGKKFSWCFKTFTFFLSLIIFLSPFMRVKAKELEMAAKDISENIVKKDIVEGAASADNAVLDNTEKIGDLLISSEDKENENINIKKESEDIFTELEQNINTDSLLDSVDKKLNPEEKIAEKENSVKNSSENYLKLEKGIENDKDKLNETRLNGSQTEIDFQKEDLKESRETEDKQSVLENDLDKITKTPDQKSNITVKESESVEKNSDKEINEDVRLGGNESVKSTTNTEDKINDVSGAVFEEETKQKNIGIQGGDIIKNNIDTDNNSDNASLGENKVLDETGLNGVFSKDLISESVSTSSTSGEKEKSDFISEEKEDSGDAKENKLESEKTEENEALLSSSSGASVESQIKKQEDSNRTASGFFSNSVNTASVKNNNTSSSAPVIESLEEANSEAGTEDSLLQKSIVFNDENKYIFDDKECTKVKEDEFYCVKAKKENKNISVADLKTEGLKLVFSKKDKDGDKEIFLMDKGQELKVTNNLFDDDAPSFDRASGIVAWHSLVNDRYQIMIYDKNSKETRQVTNTSFNNTNPQVYGNILVWQAWVGNDWDIFMAAAPAGGNLFSDSLKILQITDNNHNDMFPKIHKNILTWQSFVDSSWKVFIYNIDTKATSQIDGIDSGNLESPRFVLLFENRKENGDTEKIGYDISSGETLKLGMSSKKRSEPIPDIPKDPIQDQKRAMPINSSTSSLSKLEQDGDDGEE